jgi:C_GCAxxG_C_C family probable redox protein
MQDEALIKAMDAFGGGLGSHGEVCGAIIGGLSVIGLLFGRSKPDGAKDRRMRQYSDIFLERFKNEVANGKILCRDIAQCDWRDPDQVKRFMDSEKRKECEILTGKTAKIAGEIVGRSSATS